MMAPDSALERTDVEEEGAYHGLLVLGLHSLGDLAHLDGGRGRAAKYEHSPSTTL